MNRSIKTVVIIISVLVLLSNLTSCEKFFNPNQEISVTEDQLFNDWYEYRSASMGLYALQQELVEQLLVLGELRGDLLTVTENADADLMEIYNFSISKTNKYASPQNFFKLIAACNRFINVLENKYPNVLDREAQINNYDRLYGEALCMRAWAYFNAARIYSKVPLIDQHISTIDEINEFLNSSSTYVDSIYIIYNVDGYNNDTIYNKENVLTKQYYNIEQVIRHFTNELETKVKAVGVNHYIENQDNSWEVTIWSQWSYKTLLGHMYLTLGDLAKSAFYFEEVLYNNSENDRYQLTRNAFENNRWANIFTNIDSREHIYTLSFNKSAQQQNDLQRLFEPWGANNYMLKPTKQAIHNWETQWRGHSIKYDYNVLDSTKTVQPGIPSDYYRGFSFSYTYDRGGTKLAFDDYADMLRYKYLEEERSVETIMQNYDTVVYKYSILKDSYDQDPNYIIYRAAGANLYLAEIYARWIYENENGEPTRYIQNALNILNNGSNYDARNSRSQLGIRGRVGLGSGESVYKLDNIIFISDPFTNKIIGYKDFTNKLPEKQKLLDGYILKERALELAFEGERFYDLIRFAKRQNDPSLLAEKVAAKYSGSQRNVVYNYLLNEENWYINYFE